MSSLRFVISPLAKFKVSVIIKEGADVDIYERLFLKMSKIGFPDVYKGYKMVYYFNDFQADLCYNGSTVDRIKKMWKVYAE